ncbi:hypothetical protein HAX54_027367 [Datura stramonium]|uniref:Uncharacterized protein n=1 Tax=Datura stramonium TaxID=4076 RepID=A0ABS8V508_DATST|nr:hypothetical protein [Datura stramonium]
MKGLTENFHNDRLFSSRKRRICKIAPPKPSLTYSVYYFFRRFPFSSADTHCGGKMHQGYQNSGATDLAQLQATMQAIEFACSSIQELKLLDKIIPMELKHECDLEIGSAFGPWSSGSGRNHGVKWLHCCNSWSWADSNRLWSSTWVLPIVWTIPNHLHVLL